MKSILVYTTFCVRIAPFWFEIAKAMVTLELVIHSACQPTRRIRRPLLSLAPTDNFPRVVTNLYSADAVIKRLRQVGTVGGEGEFPDCQTVLYFKSKLAVILLHLPRKTPPRVL